MDPRTTQDPAGLVASVRELACRLQRALNDSRTAPEEFRGLAVQAAKLQRQVQSPRLGDLRVWLENARLRLEARAGCAA